jgi:hypothetical protein
LSSLSLSLSRWGTHLNSLLLWWVCCLWPLGQSYEYNLSDYLILANVMTKSRCSFQKCDKNAGCRCFYNGVTVFGWLLFTCLHPLSGSVEVNGESWHLVTAIHDEGDGQILCEWQP